MLSVWGALVLDFGQQTDYTQYSQTKWEYPLPDYMPCLPPTLKCTSLMLLQQDAFQSQPLTPSSDKAYIKTFGNSKGSPLASVTH
jgi:hypothetical protein